MGVLWELDGTWENDKIIVVIDFMVGLSSAISRLSSLFRSSTAFLVVFSLFEDDVILVKARNFSRRKCFLLSVFSLEPLENRVYLEKKRFIRV